MNSWLTFATRSNDGSKGLREKEFLHDPRMEIDLSVSKGRAESHQIREWFLGRMGKTTVVEDFEILPIAEGVLRALSRIGFRNVATVTAEQQAVYSHAERTRDLKNVLRHLGELLLGGADSVKLEVLHGKRRAVVSVSKTHPKGGHSIEIRFEGKMLCKTLNTFTEYLGDLLPIEKVDTVT